MNTCGGCTACCLAMRVPDLDKPAGEWCKHCDRGVGCMIYAERPQNCRDFDCAWLQSNASPSLRPDLCGVVFERMDDEIFYGTILPGFKITELTLEQINRFRDEGFSIVVHHSGTGEDRLFLGPKHAPSDVARRIAEWLRTPPT